MLPFSTKRTSFALLRRAVTASTRSVHNVPVLPRESDFQNDGIKGLLSPQAFKTAWKDYQTHLTDRLSELTVGTDNETRTPFHIVLNTARRSELTPTFNYASMAHNNHFFFQSLIPEKDNQTEPSDYLKRGMFHSIGSIDNLKDVMIMNANGIFGNGFTWLVETSDKRMYVVNTYNAGTPYISARSQSVDLNAPLDPEAAREHLRKQTQHILPQDLDPIPLLCVNTWQYCYLQDYGINGKLEYLENWWKAINWDIVSQRLPSNQFLRDRSGL